MQRQATADMLQRGAGVFTWAAVTGFALYIVVAGGERYGGSLSLILPLAIVNVVAMWIAMADGPDPGRLQTTALWLQLLCALAIGSLLPVSFLPIYTIIWIAMATGYFSLAACSWLLAGIMLAWYLIMTLAWEAQNVIISVVLYGTFHLFAMLTARTAHEAQRARNRAEALNRELVATQHLLSEASRQHERTRIARDLHDLLGHHLTALSLQLQIAERLSDGDAREKVARARALARLLLSDVREAVSTLRSESALDFTRAIRLLVEDTPQLEVSLDIEPNLKIDDVEVAETLLRCVQEAITNTLRHSGARHSWIRAWRDGDSIHLDVRDDGRLRGQLDEGNGLAGMRERLQQLRGSLELDTVQEALRLHVEIPLPG